MLAVMKLKPNLTHAAVTGLGLCLMIFGAISLPAQAINPAISAEEERVRKKKEALEAQRAEKWELEEFGELAGWVHNTGLKLGLTDKQKRLYHGIVKDFQQQTRGLWQDLQERNPGAEMAELQKLYKQEYEDIHSAAKREVEGILSDEQRKKYHEELENRRLHL